MSLIGRLAARLNITPRAARLAAHLAFTSTHADERGICLSYDQLTEALDAGERTIRRWARELEDAGLVTVAYGRHEYRVNITKACRWLLDERVVREAREVGLLGKKTGQNGRSSPAKMAGLSYTALKGVGTAMPRERVRGGKKPARLSLAVSNVDDLSSSTTKQERPVLGELNAASVERLWRWARGVSTSSITSAFGKAEVAMLKRLIGRLRSDGLDAEAIYSLVERMASDWDRVAVRLRKRGRKSIPDFPAVRFVLSAIGDIRAVLDDGAAAVPDEDHDQYLTPLARKLLGLPN